MEEELEQQEEDIWIELFTSAQPFKQNQDYEPRLNSAFSKNSLPRINDGAYVINLDDKNSKETHWFSLFIGKTKPIYFDYFGIEYTLPESFNKVRNKSNIYNIFRIQDNEPIMCGFSCIVFIKYMLVRKPLLNYTNLFSTNDKKNDKKIYKYFKDKCGRRIMS